MAKAMRLTTAYLHPRHDASFPARTTTEQALSDQAPKRSRAQGTWDCQI